MSSAPAAGPDFVLGSPMTTAEMLAALPEGLLVPDGAPVGDRRIGDILALYRSVFLNSTDPIAIVDSSGRYLEQNLAHEMLFGWTQDELRGKTPAMHLGDETFAQVVRDLQQSGVTHREVISRGKDGTEHVVDLSAFAVRDRSGRAVCYVGIKRDVTEQRRAAAALRRRFDELQVLYRMADALGRARVPDDIYGEAVDGLVQALGADRVSILLFDDDGVMRFKAWRGLSDSYRKAVEGHSPWQRGTRDARPILFSDVAREPSLAQLLPVITGEGIRALAFVPLADDDRLLGKLVVYFDSAHDWSDAELQLARTIARHVSFAIGRHRHDAQLRESVTQQARLFVQAHEANRAKSIFLATMSHELRTPLNAIAGYTDLLDAGVHGELMQAQRDAVQRIQTNQRHLLRLIDDVLDFAKLEAGHMQLEIANVPVQETLASTRALIEPQLRAKGIAFVYEAGDARVTCRGDRAKIQQVIANLLSNAWKFTPPGGTVTMSWEVVAETVRVNVADTGPGIPAGSLETIFEPFVQLNTGLRRHAEGTGLGLAISRELARLMGGEISATSSPGKGSTFTLTLPRA